MPCASAPGPSGDTAGAVRAAPVLLLVLAVLFAAQAPAAGASTLAWRGASAVEDQTYTVGSSIAVLRLPRAASDEGPLTFTLSPAPPAGLLFDATPSRGRLTGTPQRAQSATTYTYRVEDGAGSSIERTFSIAVQGGNDAQSPGTDPGASTLVWRGASAVENQTYTVGSSIAVLRLPRAASDEGPLTFTLSPAPPAGLLFDATPSRGRLTGTPQRAQSATTYTYRVEDGAGSSIERTFSIAVQGERDVAPVWSRESIDDQRYRPGWVSYRLSLPIATGGNGDLTFTLSPAPPAGMTFLSGSSRGWLTGKPTTAQPTTEYSYTVTDGDGDTATLRFNITVAAIPEVPVATLAGGGSPVTEGTGAVFTVRLSSPAPEGGVTVKVTVADAGDGGDFVAPENEGAKTVTVPVGQSSATYSVATVGDDEYEPNGEVTVTLAAGTGYTVGSPSSATVTVQDDDEPRLFASAIDLTPHFGSRRVSNQSYTEYTRIGTLTLPRAKSGNQPLRYTLRGNLPAGFDFDEATRQLTGTPTEAQQATTYTWTVTDADGDRASLTFTITVAAVPWDVSVSGEDSTMFVRWPAFPTANRYRVQWRTGAESYSTTERSHTAGASDTGHRLRNLTLSEKYFVRVTALRNQDGAMSELRVSDEVEHVTHGYFDAFANPAVGDARALDVEWEALGGGTAGYVIEWGESTDHCMGTDNVRSLANEDSVTEDTLTYRITGLQPDTEYDVRVTPYTTYGSASAPDGLSWTECGKPTHTEITDVTVSAGSSSTELAVSWTRGTSANAYPIEKYVVRWKSGVGDYPEANKKTVEDGTSTSTTIDNLTAGTEYTVRVAAQVPVVPYHSQLLDGDTAEGTGTTGASSWDVSVSGEDNTMFVRWPAFPAANRYRVQWRTGEESYSTTERSHTAGAGDTGHRLRDLTLGEKYFVRVTALRDESDTGGTVSELRVSGEVEHVTHALFDQFTDPAVGEARALDVEWEALGGGAAGYVIEWGESTDHCKAAYDVRPLANQDSVTGDKLTYRVTGLQPDTEYDVRVTPYTTYGSASAPDGQSFTECGKPTHTEITDVTVSAGSSSTELAVSWTRGTSANAYPIEKYVVRWNSGVRRLSRGQQEDRRGRHEHVHHDRQSDRGHRVHRQGCRASPGGAVPQPTPRRRHGGGHRHDRRIGRRARVHGLPRPVRPGQCGEPLRHGGGAARRREPAVRGAHRDGHRQGGPARRGVELGDAEVLPR